MTRLLASDIRRVKESVDIVAVIGEYVRLKRAGAEYKACCPFHKEKTPSFMVSPAKRAWHCHGCGKGGGVVDFVMAIEGIYFAATVRALAERYGVALDGENVPKQKLDLARQMAEEAAWFWTEMRCRLMRAYNDFLNIGHAAQRTLQDGCVIDRDAAPRDGGCEWHLTPALQDHPRFDWIVWCAFECPEIAEELRDKVDLIDLAEHGEGGLRPLDLIEIYREVRTAKLGAWLRKRRKAEMGIDGLRVGDKRGPELLAVWVGAA